MPSLAKIGSTLRDLNRLREILQVFAGHGFGFLIDQLHLSAYLPSRKRTCKLEEDKASVPLRIRRMLSELGPVFVKLGQVLSQRPDLLPAEYIAELSKLQDQVPPFAGGLFHSALQEALEKPAEEVFKSIDPVPIAAASIAQVHRAVTLDRREVAVKIQRPGLKKILDADIEILRLLARLWENLSGEDLPRRPVEFVNEFERLLREELDFQVEARHLERFQAHFKHRPKYRFPKIYWDLTTPRCLTLEYIHGPKLTTLPKTLSAAKKETLAQTLIDGYIFMALEDRFFHADPHPGNLLLDSQDRLVFLDAGQVGRLDSETVAAFTDMLLALVDQDTEAVVDAYLRLGTVDEGVDLRSLKKDVGVFLEQYYDLPVEKISFGRSLQDLITLSLKYRIQLPADFVVLAKTFLGAEGLARQLHPKLNLVQAAQPTAKRILRRRLEPGHLLQVLGRKARDLSRFLLGLPDQLRDLLAKLQVGHLKIEFEHKGLEEFQHSVERSSNRLSFALIVAALIIASSLLMISHIGPAWGGFSLLGLFGYLISGIFGLLLLIAILRSGKM